ncbi:MAG: Uma2 family endonuclease [Oscillatoria sp. PMC 1051.18]|nr:Uma2 family endonuclease [Oscillatoria sp. PMC 1050.18]MEC5029874.1 Uma2 family endonuclease [Oscillatoria sp. PMC 1051.18]
MTLTTSEKALTLEQFLQLPDIEESPAWEFVDGERQRKTMSGAKHSRLQFRICEAINRLEGDYEALPELRCTFGNRSLIADITVTTKDSIPVDESGEIVATGISFAPPWAIEILSPNQGEMRVTRNLLHGLRNGGQLGWLVDPMDKVVLVFKPGQLPDEFTGDEVLSVLPGVELELTVNDLFGWLRR